MALRAGVLLAPAAEREQIEPRAALVAGEPGDDRARCHTGGRAVCRRRVSRGRERQIHRGWRPLPPESPASRAERSGRAFDPAPAPPCTAGCAASAGSALRRAGANGLSTTPMFTMAGSGACSFAFRKRSIFPRSSRSFGSGLMMASTLKTNASAAASDADPAGSFRVVDLAHPARESPAIRVDPGNVGGSGHVRQVADTGAGDFLEGRRVRSGRRRRRESLLDQARRRCGQVKLARCLPTAEPPAPADAVSQRPSAPGEQ